MTTHFVPQRSFQRLIGREAEVREIMARLSSLEDRTQVVAIEGIGGLGKTAIAQEIAWRYVEEREYLPPEARFDVIIWAAARPQSRGAEANGEGSAFTALDDVFRAVAAAMEIPTLMQVSPHERPKQCWAALHLYRRVLLVVDNLEEDADDSISSFLRDLPDGVKALVTTRFHENLPRPFHLGPLQLPAARELVAAECSSRGIMPAQSELDTLARVSQGMPLAARLVVGMCAGSGIESVTRSLSDVHVKLSSEILARSVAPLEQQPEAYQCLLAFALFDSATGATGKALAACLGLDITAAGKARSRLEYLNLVQPLHEPLGLAAIEGGGEGLPQLGAALRERDTIVRYSVLPLTHEYARRELAHKPDWAERARSRLVDYYRNVAAALDDPAHYNSAVADTPNLIGVMRRLADSGEVNRLADLLSASQEFLYAQSAWDELLEFATHIRDTLKQARAPATPQTLIALLQSPVDIYRRRGQMQVQGEPWVNSIQTLSDGLHDRLLESEIDLARRRLLCNDGTLGTTAQLVPMPASSFDEVGVHLRRDDPDFVDDVKTAVRVFTAAGRVDKVFQAYVTLGNFHRVIGSYYHMHGNLDRMHADFNRALRCYDQALEVLANERPRTSAWRETRTGVVRASQALVAGRMGRVDEACEVLSAARVALVDTVDRVEADTARAYYEYRRGNRDRALSLRTAADAAKVRLGVRVPLCLEEHLWNREVSPTLTS